MAFNNYLEDENDKPYFTQNSLAYYYDKMEGFAKAVEGSAKALNLTKEEIEQRIALRLAEWDGKLEGFDSSVETLLTEWVDDGTLTHVIDSTLIDQKIAETEEKTNYSNQIVDLSLLLSDNPAQQIETFLSNSLNKRFIFPFGITVILEKPLIIQNLINCDIDFNSVELKIPDNCKWQNEYIGETYLDKAPLIICNGHNVTTRNIVIDGNKQNNTINLFGLQLFNMNNYKNYALTFKGVNYHALHIQGNTKKISFYGKTSFLECGAGIPANSDIYISNNIGDDFYFEDVYSERDGSYSGGQIFYVNGYNGHVKKITGKRSGSPYDARLGKHLVETVHIDDCDNIIIQSHPGGMDIDKPSIQINTIKATGITAKSTTGAALIYITSGRDVVLGDVYIEGKTGVSENWHVLRVDHRISENYFPENISIKSLKGKGTNANGIAINNMKDNVNIDYVDIEVSNLNAFSFTVDNKGKGGKLVVKDFKLIGFNYGLYGGTEKFNIVTMKPFLEKGTSAERPLNIPAKQIHFYYDETLSKLIFWNGASWRNLDGTTVV